MPTIVHMSNWRGTKKRHFAKDPSFGEINAIIEES